VSYRRTGSSSMPTEEFVQSKLASDIPLSHPSLNPPVILRCDLLLHFDADKMIGGDEGYLLGPRYRQGVSGSMVLLGS
jgi:hypothetical protein